jgi:hypothetical protein
MAEKLTDEQLVEELGRRIRNRHLAAQQARLRAEGRMDAAADNEI